MRAEFAAAVLVIAASVFGVRFWEAHADLAGRPVNDSAIGAALTASPRDAGKTSAHSAGRESEVRLTAARDRQYYVTAAVNGSPAPFLVDTGATYVALRESDARRAGLRFLKADFNQPVRTANGETFAVLVTLEEVEINGILIENVEALVLSDEQLGVNLLGMSFLSRLESVEARGGELVLRG